MFDEKKSLEMIEGFGNHYNYDVNYMKEMLKVSPKAYEKFEAFLPMGNFIDKASFETIFVARITAMKNEDCGACLQLNIDMALEAGVDSKLIEDIVFNEGKNLPKDLKQLHSFTLKVSNNEFIDEIEYDKINNLFSKEVLIEISLAIASTKVYPAIKRVLGSFKSCSVISVKV